MDAGPLVYYKLTYEPLAQELIMNARAFFNVNHSFSSWVPV